MAEYRINESGELVIEDDDCDVTVTPEEDFPQILALIAPTPANPTVEPTADRVEFYFANGHLNWRCGDAGDEIFAAYGADRLDGIKISDGYGDMAAWLIKNQPAVTIDQVKAWGRWSSAQEPVYDFIQAQADPQSAAKDGPWYMDGEYLKHRKQTTGNYIIDTDVCDDHDATAAWFVATQPEVSAADWAYLTDSKTNSVACLRRLREIRARLESAAAQDCDLPCEDCDCATSAPSERLRAAAQRYLADVAPAPETPAQRNVVITITFDPANTHAAETIYRAVNSIDWEYRRDSVRTHVE